MDLVATYLLGPFQEMAEYPQGIVETVIAGLGNGFLYALVAVGFVIIYKSSSVFNFAQGAMVFFAALNFAGLLKLGVPWYLAGLAALLIMVAFAFAVERVVLRPLVGQDGLSLFMATIGISFFVEGLVEAVWGGNPHLLKIGLPESAIFTIDYAWAEKLGLDIIIQQSDLLAIGIGLVLILCLYLFFQYSKIGRALRAVADDHTASMSIGIPLNQMWVVVWALSGLTAFIAATIWGTKIQVEPTMINLALKALPVLILGGLTSIPGAVIGGCIIGVSELMFETYWGQP
jgi:branched-chain amino acid transport system permease protein